MIIAKFKTIFIWTFMAVLLMTPMLLVPSKVFADDAGQSDIMSDASQDASLGYAKSGNGVKLTWTVKPANPKVVKYHIVRSGDVVATTSSTSYIDSKFSAPPYRYQIFGLDKSGKAIIKSQGIDVDKFKGELTTDTTKTLPPDPDTGTGEDQCKDTGVQFWHISTWSIGSSIAGAICQMQVALIQWESEILCDVVNGVLLPTLGLGGGPNGDQENTDACKAPAT